MSPPIPDRPTGERRGSLRSILLNTGWMLGGKGVGAVLSLIYLAIVTRSLGIEGFGTFALAFGTAQAAVAFVTFQSWQVVVRFGMPHLHAGRSEALTRLVRFTTFLDVAGAAVGILLVSAGILLLGDRFFGWSPDFIRQALAICVVYVLAIHQTPIGLLRLHDRFATAALCDSVTPIVRCAGAVAVLLIQPSVAAYLAVWAAAEVLTAAAYWVAALRLPRLRWRLDETPRLATVFKENEGLGRFAVATNLSSSLTIGSNQLPLLVVGLSVTTAAAGAYRLAQQLAQAAAKLSQLMSRAIFPELMRAHTAERAEAGLERLLADTSKLAAKGAALIFVLLLLFGYPLAGLVGGPQFLSAYPILLVLGTAAAIDLAAVGFEPALAALGRAGLALRMRFIATALLVALLLILPRWYGGLGAAVAVLVASCASFLLLWLSTRSIIRRTAGQALGGESA